MRNFAINDWKKRSPLTITQTMRYRRTQSDLRSAIERGVKGALKVSGRSFGLRAISIRAEPTRDDAPRNGIDKILSSAPVKL